MSIKLDVCRTGRTDAIKKTVGTDYYETNAAQKKASPRAPVAAFSKGKKSSFAEEGAKRNKNPGAGEYKTDKAYAMISSSPMMKRRC